MGPGPQIGHTDRETGRLGMSMYKGRAGVCDSIHHSPEWDAGAGVSQPASGPALPPASGCTTPPSPRDRSVPKHLLMDSQKHPPSKFLGKINRENVTTASRSHQITPGGGRKVAVLRLLTSSSRSQTEWKRRHPLLLGHPFYASKENF